MKSKHLAFDCWRTFISEIFRVWLLFKAGQAMTCGFGVFFPFNCLWKSTVVLQQLYVYAWEEFEFIESILIEKWVGQLQSK